MLDAFYLSRDVVGGRGHHGCAVDTVAFYREKGAQLVRVLGDRPVDQMRAADVEAYIRRRRAEEVKDATIAKEIGVLRAALRRAHRDGDVELEADRIVPDFRAAYVPRTRWLPRSEFDRLVVELRPERRAVVEFVVYSGARDREWQRLRREHVDQVNQVLTLPGSKTPASWRRIPYGQHPELAALLERRLALRIGGGPLFTAWGNRRRDIRAACARAKIEPVSMNDLRRTFGSWLRQAGVPLDRIAKLLGTSVKLVEKTYGQLRTIEDLEGEIAKAFGRGRAA